MCFNCFPKYKYFWIFFGAKKAFPRILWCVQEGADIHVDKILPWLNKVQQVSSWAEYTTIIQIGRGLIRGGGGQRIGWTVCSGKILGRSDRTIYSDISWKELAVLAWSAELIHSSQVILSLVWEKTSYRLVFFLYTELFFPTWAVDYIMFLSAVSSLTKHHYWLISSKAPPSHTSFLVRVSLNISAGFVFCC